MKHIFRNTRLNRKWVFNDAAPGDWADLAAYKAANLPKFGDPEDIEESTEDDSVARFRAARQAAYEAAVTLEDQADATFKHLAWAQMRAGVVRNAINASSMNQENKDLLLDILSCFNAISEVDDIIAIRNQIKADIRLEDFQ